MVERLRTDGNNNRPCRRNRSGLALDKRFMVLDDDDDDNEDDADDDGDNCCDKMVERQTYKLSEESGTLVIIPND